jgi:hypothetical protein
VRCITRVLALRWRCVSQVTWTDPLWLAAQLYSDPELQEGKLTELEVIKTDDGMRQYTELNTAKWWEEAESEMNREAPVCFVALCCADVALRCAVFYCAGCDIVAHHHVG